MVNIAAAIDQDTNFYWKSINNPVKKNRNFV